MGSRGRFAFICLVVFISVTVPSASDTARNADAVRMLPHVPPAAASIVELQKRDLPWESQADIRERQTLAWIILLMKDGRAAR